MHSSMGGFSSSSEYPSPGEMLRMARRFSAPDNEAPVAVPTSAVLGRGPDAAVLLTSVLAYSTGAEFGLAIRVRQGTGRRTRPLHELMGGFGARDIDANQAFLLGVQYADGRRAVTSGRHGIPTPPDEDGEDSLSLALGSSSGGDNTYDLQLWLSPLPPPGPVTIVCRWPDLDIQETTVTLDGAALAAAGHAAAELWPPELPHAREPEPPTTRLPDSGWFAGRD